MDEYIERAKATEFISKCLNYEEKLQSVERETLIAVKEDLESIPAADVRPVVRGRWVKVVHAIAVTTANCSECGCEAVWRSRTKAYAL